MQRNVSKDIIEKWLRGWSLSRQLPLPTRFKSAFKVEVGYDKQKIRYVFPNLNEDVIDLAKAIVTPWTFLKVCAPPDELQNLLPPRWIIQPQGYMMTCFHRMIEKPVHLDVGYKIELEEYDSIYHVKLIGKNGERAGDGRVVLVDDLAIYDRIFIDINHRRKGLATFLMKELEKIALSKRCYKNFLVATEDGKLLYSSLGWKLYCLYTSVVIPDN